MGAIIFGIWNYNIEIEMAAIFEFSAGSGNIDDGGDSVTLETVNSSECRVCSGEVVDRGIQCDGKCGGWFHPDCSGLSCEKYEELSVGESKNEKWYCKNCRLDEVCSKQSVEGGRVVKGRKEAKKEVVSNVSGQFKVKSPAVVSEDELLVSIQHCYKDIRDEWHVTDTNSTSTVKALKKQS